MAQRVQIVPCTLALVALLAVRLPSAYTEAGEEAVDVRESGNADFNDKGELVLKKVAVRVRFGTASYGQTRDISKTTLSADLKYQIICRHESLRGRSEMRSRSLALVECVQAELAGARLLLGDGNTTDPIELEGVQPVSDSFGPVEDCYGVSIAVTGFAQFDGRNANPPGGNA